jgi:hypothetical protein
MPRVAKYGFAGNFCSRQYAASLGIFIEILSQETFTFTVIEEDKF